MTQGMDTAQHRVLHHLIPGVEECLALSEPECATHLVATVQHKAVLVTMEQAEEAERTKSLERAEVHAVLETL